MVRQLLLLCALLGGVAGRVARISDLGCYVDYTYSTRDLNGLSGVSSIGQFNVLNGGYFSSSNMTHEMCSQVCSLGGFLYFGVQVGQQCFCGNSFGSQGNASDTKCAIVCSGNSLQKCGAAAHNSVFGLTYADRNVYMVVNGSGLTVVTSQTSFWPASAKSDADCLLQCSARDDCQAVVFSQRLLTCHLLAFAYPPASLTGPDWALYVRG